MLNIRYFAPHPRLRHLIRTYYTYEAELPAGGIITDHLITEYANLRVMCGSEWTATSKVNGTAIVPQVCLAGPNSHPTHVQVSGNFKMFGMGIKPLGWQALMGIPASDFADYFCDAKDVLGADFREIAIEIVERASSDEALVDQVEAQIFGRLANRQYRMSPIVRAMQDAMAGDAIRTVSALSDITETSPRQLERLAKTSFGYSPKTLLRHARIHRNITSLKGLGSQNWEDVATQDFADQSHMIHEFKRFTGKTPSSYRTVANPLMDAAYAMQASLQQQMRMSNHPGERLKAELYFENIGASVIGFAEAA
jgi:AraC-like DNA-binding protein